jgi:hypothetical protein
VRDYIIHVFDSAGTRCFIRSWRCASDQEAALKLATFANKHTVELWDGRGRLLRIDRLPQPMLPSVPWEADAFSARNPRMNSSA